MNVTARNDYVTTSELRSRYTYDDRGNLRHHDYATIPAGTNVVRCGSRQNAIRGTEIFVAVPSLDGYLGEYVPSYAPFYRADSGSVALR